MNEKNLVCIQKDDVYSIFLAKDNHKGIDIQVGMLMDVTKPNAKGEMVQHKTQVVVYKNYIAMEVEKQINDKLEEHLTEGIKIARQKVSELKSKDRTLDKIMDQYRSANEKLNGPQEKNS